MSADSVGVAMTEPLFSLIVPALNVSTTLHASLDSIAHQTCADFELILVDGGSTDGTLDVAKDFASRLGGRLTVHCDPDRGPYDAMNRGVSLSTGAWLFFLGADDTLYDTDTLSRVADFIRGHEPSDLVYGDVIMRSTGLRYAGEFDLDRLLFEQNICHQAIFYRRELFAGIGPYNLRYRLWADWDFNIRCFSNPALVTRYMDIVVAHYDDTSGLSRREDEELKKSLPVFIRGSALSRKLARSKRSVDAWRNRTRNH